MLTDILDPLACVLENAYMRLEVLPAIGGKIASLTDVRSGREWLWRNPILPIQSPTYGASYVRAHDSGGFDECFPTVGEGEFPTAPWEGIHIPDHGELWALAWDHEATSTLVKMGVDGVRFPYRFERTLELSPHAAELRLSYRVVNRSPFPFPFLWSSHPLFSIEPGMRVLLPDQHPLKVYGASDESMGQLGSSLTWPQVADRDLSVVPRPTAGFSAKLFGASPERGWVGLHDPRTETTLRMEYDPALVPHLGLWLNMGGWTPFDDQEPYFNLALEPCIGVTDDLALAVRHYRQHGLIPPKGEVTWSMTLRLVPERQS